RLSLVSFFGESKKETAPPGAHPGLRHLPATQRSIRQYCKIQNKISFQPRLSGRSQLSNLNLPVR
ncbi:MAG: hypothetical protein KDG56_00575, partial [Ottowia sp.]|nr:hypothetical protein [Ottowia sp.]